MIRRPPRSTRRSSDLGQEQANIRREICATDTNRLEICHTDVWPGLFQTKMVRAGANHFKRKLIRDRKSTRLNSSHSQISYAVFCLKKKKSKKSKITRE